MSTVPKTLATAEEASARQSGSFRLAVTGPGDPRPTIHVVDAPFLLIGRARGCGLRLDHAAVDRRHIYLQTVLGRIYCIDLSDEREPVRGDGPRNAHWLDPEQAIQVGPYEVRLVETPDAPNDDLPAGFHPLDRYAGQLGPMPKVQIEFFERGTYQTTSSISRLIVLGGSSPKCKLRLQDNSVSAVHFSFVMTHDGLWVVDLAGREGIAVNSQPVISQKLDDRDELRVGNFLLRIRYSAERLGDPAALEARPPGETSWVGEGPPFDERVEELEALRA